MTNDEARELTAVANEAAEEMAAIVHKADEERAAIVQRVADRARQLAEAHTSGTETAEGKKYLTGFEYR